MRFQNPARRSRRPKFNANRTQTRPRDPIITAQRFPVPNIHIPQHISNPSVTRVVRLPASLTTTSSSYNVTYALLAYQDSLDYGITTTRYLTMRVSQIRVYAESPPVASDPIGLEVTETSSLFTVVDRPVTGASLSSVGIRLPFAVRASIVPCTSTVVLVNILADRTIVGTLILSLNIDATCEFY
jgi:hypothetical protein